MKTLGKLRISNKMQKVIAIGTGLTIAGAIGVEVARFTGKPDSYEENDSSYSVQLDKTKKGDNTVSLFNVGSSKLYGKSNIRDIKRANKKDIPVGVVINSIAEDRADIYKDVDYAKYLVQEADVRLVYLDVNNMMANESLRVDEVLALISDFGSKLTSNKVYVGIAGTEANIAKLREYDSENILKEYDTYLTDNDISLDTEKNVFSIFYRDKEGKLRTKEDIVGITDREDLSRSKNFKFDTIYYPRENDTWADIAYRYGLSVEDLLEYNDLKSNVKLPDVKWLKIPTIISNATTAKKVSAKTDDSLKMGLDMSGWQTNVDWKKIEKVAEFIILRATVGEIKDKRFEGFARQCMERDIPMGAFCYNKAGYSSDTGWSNANSLDNATFKKLCAEQTHKFIESISGKKVDLPAYIDYEEVWYDDDKICILLENWKDSMKKVGYTPGLYCDKSHYAQCKKAYDAKYGRGALEKAFNTWVSGDFGKTSYNQEDYRYSQHVRMIENNEAPSFSSSQYNVSNADIVQVSSRGVGFGAGNGSGYVDVDYTYMDLNNLNSKEKLPVLTEEEQEFLAINAPKQQTKLGYQISETLEDANDYVVVGSAAGAGMLLGLGLAGLINRKRRSKITPTQKVIRRR